MKKVTSKVNKTRFANKTGLPPGSLIHVGRNTSENVKITLIEYDETSFKETEINDLKQLEKCKELHILHWIKVEGVHNKDVMEFLGNLFDLHILALEDIMNTEHRPKVDDYDHYLLQTIKLLYINKQNELESEQVSLILTKSTVISFSEKPSQLFDPVKERIQLMKTKISSRGADYLFYALMDIVIDQYFIILDTINEQMDDLEEDIFNKPDNHSLQVIQKNKRDLLLLRKQIYPLRESVNKLQKAEIELITKKNQVFFNDTYDHIILIIDIVENLRDINTGLKDMYLSSISLKMNEVMKVLTIISTIFIPLTFIAGIYGMNFDYMPELRYHYGYFAIWGVIILITSGLLIIFKKRKWL